MRKLILVGGPAGSGKTHFSEDLAEHLGAAYLDKDTLSHAFTGKILELLGQNEDDKESNVYQEYIRPLEYSTLEALAIDNICLRSTDVVCSAPFATQFQDTEWLDNLELTAKAFDAALVLVWMHSDATVANTRIAAREESRDAWKLNNWDAYNQVAGYNPPALPRPLHVIENKTNVAEDLDQQMDKFLATLSQLDEAHKLISEH